MINFIGRMETNEEQMAPRRIIIFDTETTGLPKAYRKSALEERNNWPDLVSISWQIFDQGRLEVKEHFIIRPNGWIVSDESAKFHKITHDMAERVGRPLEEVLKKFKHECRRADRLVAHNMAFDSNVMINAYKWRLSDDVVTWWPYKKEFCTMLASMNELKIPAKYPTAEQPFKWPGLDELYRATFAEEAPADAHSADRDVEVLQKIYFARYESAPNNCRIM